MRIRARRPAADPADSALGFAISTHQRWSNPAANEFDVFVDVNGDHDNRSADEAQLIPIPAR